MKAIYYDQYGSPEVLQYKDVETPTPKENEVLIKIHAASVNSWDWDMLTGKPLLIRMWGLFRPKYKIPGGDISGEVEAVGKSVTRFKPGDAVFGDLSETGWGGFAQYVCAPETVLTLKPDSMTHQQAAAIPQGAVMALQGLRYKQGVQAGHNILINGSGGAAGTFAIQIAKHFGATVTAVDSRIKFDMIRSLGADHLIDYTKEDYTQNGKTYDLILDFTCRHSFFDYKRSLTPRGVYLMVGGTMPRIFQALLLCPIFSRRNGKTLRILGIKPNEGMDTLIELFESGAVLPVIKKSFPLPQTGEALRLIGRGHTLGKVVITVAHEDNTATAGRKKGE